MDKKLLKEILSIPSYTGNESKLVHFICAFLEKNKIPYKVDELLNIYCTKGDADIYAANKIEVKRTQEDKE